MAMFLGESMLLQPSFEPITITGRASARVPVDVALPAGLVLAEVSHRGFDTRASIDVFVETADGGWANVGNVHRQQDARMLAPVPD